MTDLISREAALAAVHEADSLELVQHGASVISERISILPAAQVKVKPLVWRKSVGPQGVEWNAFCALLDKGWVAYSGGAMREIDAVRAARVLAVLDLSPKPVDASQTPDPVVNDPRVKALVEAAYAEGFSEGADGGWIEGDYSKPWSKSAALRAIGGEA